MVFATCMQAYALQDANLTHCAEMVNLLEKTQKKKKKKKKKNKKVKGERVSKEQTRSIEVKKK